MYVFLINLLKNGFFFNHLNYSILTPYCTSTDRLEKCEQYEGSSYILTF